jgi:hypothetical protein
MTLPDCMMPDGADPCIGHRKLVTEVESLRAALADKERQIERLRALLEKCPNHIRGNIGEWRKFLAPSGGYTEQARKVAELRVAEGEELLRQIEAALDAAKDGK